ncbi:MAG: hypothetical protein ABI679_10785 [Gemmatimonadota bacterium]
MRRRRHLGSKGVALLEAIIALAILSIGGLSTLGVVTEALKAQHDARAREETITTSSRVLAAMTLLQGKELDQRLGAREVGEFVVKVSRPEKRLFRLAISETKYPEVELLVTVVYKP